ncbi:pentatricopeptide repeat-containing protein At1g19720-like [Tasmannia lanceolata]|uniref:pentatricopeptide repeat-containing protein At1g19720-like n=1 Tax=Tasmannia lanceolata TaxID=3420 RepID=UPI0040640CC8
MASAILKIPQNSLSQNTHHWFSSKNPKLVKKQGIPSDLIKLCSENRLKEAVGALAFIQNVGNSPATKRIYGYLLHSVASQRDLVLAKKVYDHMTSSNLHRNVYFATKIVFMFVKCRSLGDAYEVFEGVKDKNLHLWSVMLNGFCGNGRFDEALRVFCDFSATHLKADGFVLSSVLRACGGSGNLRLGREIHGFVYRSAYECDVFVGNCLVDMYWKCGCIDNARAVFDRMPKRDVISWNSILKGYSEKDDFDGFVRLVEAMEGEGVKPNLITWNTMISGYAVYGRSKEALNCFYKMQSAGVKPDLVSCNALISGLAKNGYFEEALKLFRQMRTVNLEPDIVSWTTLIKGYASLGFLKEALSLFSQVQCAGFVLDELVISVVLKACGGLQALKQGKEIHGYIIRNCFFIGTYLCVSLEHMYAKCGKLDLARKLLSNKNIVSWNTLISGYMQNGNVDEAKEIFHHLESEPLKPDLVSWNMMIDCHAQEGNINGALDTLDRMQSAGISPDLVSWNSLIKGYTKNRQINDAMHLLNRMESLGFKYNSASWNTLISNHVNHGDGEEALKVFQLMKNHGVKPDVITVSCILHACALLRALQLGKSVHGWIIRRNTIDKYINSALIQMYISSDDLGSARKLFPRTYGRNLVMWNGMISGLAKSGKLNEAQRLLHEMRSAKLKPDVISWTAIMSGYIDHGNADIALEIWSQMWQSGVKPDPISVTAASTACARLGMLDTGKEIHGFSITTGMERDPAVQASLITMYSKCGNIKEAVCLFESAPHKSTVVWNSMISSYVMHGHGELAISLFQRMQNEGAVANSITFIGVLSACCQMNFSVQDWGSCDVMLQDSGFKHDQRNYAQMANVAKNIFKLDDGYLESCGLLRSKYAKANAVDGCASKFRTGIKEPALVKSLQSSWIYIKRKRHRFDEGVSDSEINSTLDAFNALNRQMIEAGL